LEIGRGEVLMDGDDLAVIAVGVTVYPAVEASRLLAEKGIRATVINARFVKPLDRELILKAASRTGVLLTVEENALAGGFGSAILELLESAGMFDVRVKRIGIPDRFIEHGSQAQLRADLGLDAAGITASAGELLIRGNTSAPALARIK
jgi:1-deoxy-D-xylulose-5-phosphate synthase